MTDGICFAGLEVHARRTAAAAVQLGSGEVFKGPLVGVAGTGDQLVAEFAVPGPCGQ